MRVVLAAVVALSLCGCSEERPRSLPMAPSSPIPAAPVPSPPPPAAPAPAPVPPRLTFVWVVVLGNDSGVCVRNAVVEIVAGQGVGRSLNQNTPCNYWDPDYNAVFWDLIAGVEVTLRASAPGYSAVERTVIPTTGGQTAITFELPRMR